MVCTLNTKKLSYIKTSINIIKLKIINQSNQKQKIIN